MEWRGWRLAVVIGVMEVKRLGDRKRIGGCIKGGWR